MYQALFFFSLSSQRSKKKNNKKRRLISGYRYSRVRRLTLARYDGNEGSSSFQNGGRSTKNFELVQKEVKSSSCLHRFILSTPTSHDSSHRHSKQQDSGLLPCVICKYSIAVFRTSVIKPAFKYVVSVNICKVRERLTLSLNCFRTVAASKTILYIHAVLI